MENKVTTAKVKESELLYKKTEKARLDLIPKLKESILNTVKGYWEEDKKFKEDLNNIKSMTTKYEYALQKLLESTKLENETDKEFNKYKREHGIAGPQGPIGPQGPTGNTGSQGESGIYFPNTQTQTQLFRDEEKKLLRELTLNKIISQLVIFVTNEDYVSERLEDKVFASDVGGR